VKARYRPRFTIVRCTVIFMARALSCLALGQDSYVAGLVLPTESDGGMLAAVVPVIALVVSLASVVISVLACRRA
jgi:hypothetical protein